ncbi:MAG: threonine/serine exporter family protein [Peptococcaceae bacterium]|nr:threonine/serine exporter family protein [Peptococcaceae bacterium]
MAEHYDLQKALKLAVMLGAALMENGAEIYRVEESIVFVLRAYGAKRIDVYALPNIIIVTIETDDEISYTKTRRIIHRTVDFERLIRLNDLARRLSANPVPPDDAIDELSCYCRGCGHSPIVAWTSYALAAASFSVMGGGSIADAGVAIFCVFMARLVTVPLEQRHANDFFSTMIATYIQIAVAFLFSTFFPQLHMNAIVVGTLMMLFPGRGFMTAVRDVIAKDLSAGLIETVEAIVIAVAIAIGSALAYATFPFLMEVLPI